MRASTTRRTIFMSMVYLCVCVALLSIPKGIETYTHEATESSSLSLHLQRSADPRETYECAAPRWVETFERKYGGHVVEMFVLLYLFVGMAVVIDEYFVPSLEDLMTTANFTQDVIGATFLSFANASPEIFVSIVSTIRTGKVNDGLSAVIGAVVYNLLVVAAACILMAPVVPFTLSRSIIIRDLFVCFVVLTAVLMLFAQGKAGLIESCLLLLLYPIYLIFLFMSGSRNTVPSDNQNKHDETESLIPPSTRSAREHSYDEESSQSWKFAIRVMYVVTWFWEKLFGLLFFHKHFAVTFTVSMGCIMGLSFGVLVMVKRLECGLEINGDLIGLTLVGIGLTIPNTLSNGLMAKQGHTDLAFSSVLNSNVAGMLIGMAGPWTVINIIHSAPVKLRSGGLKAAVLLLSIAYLIFATSIILTSWTLTRFHAVMFLMLYVVFLVLILTGVMHGLM
eukprot:c2958_g1_i1.p1 GENE.c2958_g1_i1~~c2958_g1_i1.p1  ORF type:complete len:450 (+),score=67.60 c2958_g1_i1:42-1391(+)